MKAFDNTGGDNIQHLGMKALLSQRAEQCSGLHLHGPQLWRLAKPAGLTPVPFVPSLSFGR